MLDHLEIQTKNISAVTEFYKQVLTPLGYELSLDDKVKGFGATDGLNFFIVSGSPSVDVHYAFRAPNRELVKEIYSRAKKCGLTLDREPALATHIHDNYFAAYLRDPDGRLVEFVCHNSESN